MPRKICYLIIKFTLSLSILFAFFNLRAQEADTGYLNQLPDIQVKAFEQNRKLKDVPAAINLVNRSILDRYGSSSVVQAINTLPGVRMEERSPGSFRLNIRGSSLRSPFGVRNVKTYFNDIPVTDPGGQTYLNQLGYYNFNSIEIIKGPGSSLYGSGTGGVMIIESSGRNEINGLTGEYSTGSYGYHNIHADIITGSPEKTSKIGFQHQQSQGYRDHSELKRNVHSWTGEYKFHGNDILKTSFLYGDLFYETPGALTQTEFENDPAAARPSSGGFPGAEQAKASIRQRTFLSGASYDQYLGSGWRNKSVVYGMFTELKNPTLRNYGKSSEPHLGGRTLFNFSHNIKNTLLKADAGGEWQAGFSTVNIHKNNSGSPDSLLTHDEINNRQSFLFAQLSVNMDNWSLVAGASWNWIRLRFQRFTPASPGLQKRSFNNQLAPRLALLRKFGQVNLYSSVSKGFSPPTTSELLPTGGSINPDLNAEQGINYDLGVKGILPGNIYFDINAFLFYLDHTIVQRRDPGGGDYYLNAGKTRQRGLETYVSIPLFARSAFFNRSLLWASHTWHDFHYRQFSQLNNDYSGKQLPGTPSHTISSGVDLQVTNGINVSFSYYFSGRIPLNDANSVFADPYHLLGIKLAYRKLVHEKWLAKIQAGADNLLNQSYSLGNDINGFGGRYFNAAPRRNYYAGLFIQWIAKKQSS